MGDQFKVEGDLGIGELSPGVTPRRYTPEGGLERHRNRIHRESKIADSKNLPFTFSKPKRPGRKKFVKCNDCGKISQAGINTVGIICSECKKYVSIEEVSDNG